MHSVVAKCRRNFGNAQLAVELLLLPPLFTTSSGSERGVWIPGRKITLMPQIECTISPGLWAALQMHAKAAQEPVAHIVNRALADYLDTARHTVYQVSTANALVEGVYQGAVRIANLREHGDLGLGTFEELDGEMVILDGKFYQVRCDGSVREMGDDVLTPFAVITRFSSDAVATLDLCPDIQRLTSCFDELRRSDNELYGLKVTGNFEHVRTRAVCRTKEGVPLVQAAAVQPEFDFHDVSGALVGFWSPEYARSLNVPGYHLHFLSDDRNCGGHLLQCSGTNLSVQIQREGSYHIALPETEHFLKADLRGDPTADLARAEGEKK
jgi:acetolactate decarboxylase